MGNTFVLLLAGHESTANTLAALMALLAGHPDEQERLYEEVTKVIEEDGELGFAQYDKLPRTLAAFIEASRLYPAGHVAIRECTEDTVLKVPSSDQGGSADMVMPKGSTVILDFIGMRACILTCKDEILTHMQSIIHRHSKIQPSLIPLVGKE